MLEPWIRSFPERACVMVLSVNVLVVCPSPSTVSLTSGCNAWSDYLACSGFQEMGDADGNLGTALYRVLAWR